MRSPRLLSLAALSLAALLVLPTAAEGPGSPRLLDAIYLGKGRILDAAPPRQLSLNAHVGEFAYQPGGLEIAYTGADYQNGRLTSFVRLAGVRRGETVALASKTIDVRAAAAAQGISEADLTKMEADAQLHGPPGGDYALRGWSADGRYLLISDGTPEGGPSSPQYLCVDVGTDSPQARPVALPAPPTPGQAVGITSEWWSPQHTRILFSTTTITEDAQHTRTVLCWVYDPAQNRLDSDPLPDGIRLLGWLDEGHLLLLDRKTPPQYLSLDLATGRDAAIPKPPKLPAYPDGPEGNSSSTSPAAPYLSLDVQPHRIVDAQKVAAIESNALWVRRTQGPSTMSAVSVGLTPGPASPQAVWSPTGKQVAYLSHGDLFVTDLIVRAATPREKLAAGEKLPCPEERQLATDNLKQIGLALLMYVQDYDENFPPAAGVNDRVLPYIKDSDVFSLGVSRFSYQPPSSPALAKIDRPAETVIGTYDVPCAHIVLYADGHVRQFPKQGYQP